MNIVLARVCPSSEKCYRKARSSALARFAELPSFLLKKKMWGGDDEKRVMCVTLANRGGSWGNWGNWGNWAPPEKTQYSGGNLTNQVSTSLVIVVMHTSHCQHAVLGRSEEARGQGEEPTNAARSCLAQNLCG